MINIQFIYSQQIYLGFCTILFMIKNIIITERFSEVNCFRRIGESDREAHALNRIFWPICRFFVRKLQVGDKVKWQ